MGLDKDDVFAQGIKSPECVKLIFNCLQNLEIEMKKVKEILLLRNGKLKALSYLTR